MSVQSQCSIKIKNKHFEGNVDDLKFSLITANPVKQNLNINKKITETSIKGISKTCEQYACNKKLYSHIGC